MGIPLFYFSSIDYVAKLEGLTRVLSWTNDSKSGEGVSLKRFDYEKDLLNSFVELTYGKKIFGSLAIIFSTFIYLYQKFDELRIKVLSQLLGCKRSQIPDHAYLSLLYGGLGWTKASILTSCTFIGGCRNALFEFSERLAVWYDLLMTTQGSTIFASNEEISKIDVEKWIRCFPQSFSGNIPGKNLNLKYTLRKLQN
ncbi:hypothetical protein P9112_003197 [Eukaryota sp. TZLM1-RC]